MYGLTGLLKANAGATPASMATRHRGRSQSWSAMRERVARLAAALRQLGVNSGDRVAMLALNSDRYLEYYFAVWWAGAAVVPMNTRWSADENSFALKDAGARVLFIDDSFAPMLGAMSAEVELAAVVFTGDGEAPAGALDYETLIAGNEPCEDAGRGGADLAGLYYTGGTTGFPKGVMLSQQALWFNNLCVVDGSSYLAGDVFLHGRAHVPPRRRRLLRCRLRGGARPCVHAELRPGRAYNGYRDGAGHAHTAGTHHARHAARASGVRSGASAQFAASWAMVHRPCPRA